MKKVGRLPPRLELVDVAVDNLLKPAWREGAAAEIEEERQRREESFTMTLMLPPFVMAGTTV